MLVSLVREPALDKLPSIDGAKLPCERVKRVERVERVERVDWVKRADASPKIFWDEAAFTSLSKVSSSGVSSRVAEVGPEAPRFFFSLRCPLVRCCIMMAMMLFAQPKMRQSSLVFSIAGT